MTSWEDAGNTVLHQLITAGYEAYIVGGAVRDRLLNRPLRDVDICTTAAVEEILQLFPAAVAVGARHGTVVVPVNGLPVEVSEFKRKNGKGSLMTDLSLRDFTCNAMAMNEHGDLIDPFGGQAAINNRIIQVVGGSPERFLEDPLRLLRALRFAVELRFAIDPQTEAWMTAHAALAAEPAVERIANELKKAANNRLDKKALIFLVFHPVCRQLPKLFSSELLTKERLETMDESLFIQGETEWWTLSAFSKAAEETRAVLKHYKVPNELQKKAGFLVDMVWKGLQTPWDRFDLYRLGKDNIVAGEKLRAMLSASAPRVSELMSRYNQLPVHSSKDIAVSGNDLLQWFPDHTGRDIGNALKLVERQIVSGRLNNTKTEIQAWLTREKVL
ncbi:tRNA nucleotidyltransferase (CCA-adding enzyme) [Evansella caseinilytica]|uniref:tRNA nucleotidyltransferase (CCA-adding enzyme) n=1 Tax=Evansella caseinilytica TaxID=1503961 RepID=A0A1H3NIP6_9BACI|nr:CCA tRNA nucleotidyltransferase [Evansella caseinilytica]SDY88109.1 tRNA nucleotidyltransferase (CCA-adding enzyme) [Evansella caseinilytica]